MLTDKNTLKNRPIKSKWLKRGTSDNRVIAIGVFIFAVLMASQIWHHRDLQKIAHDNAKLEAARNAQYIHTAIMDIIPLVEEGGGIIDEFLEPLSDEFHGKIRIVHSASIDAQYGTEPHESPKNDAEFKALQDGIPQEWETDDSFIFMKSFKAAQFCQECHHLPGKPDEPVPIGYVLGLVEVTVPKIALKEQVRHIITHTNQSMILTIILILLFAYGTHRAKIVLGESEKKTRAIFKTVGEGIVVIGPDSIIHSTNHELCKIFGYSEHDLTGREITMLMPEKYRHDHTTGMKRYLAEGNPNILGRRRELEGLRSDGTIFPIELRIEETLVGEGKDRFFALAIRDITERKRAEEELKASEHELQKSLSLIKSISITAPNAHIITNTKGIILSANPSAETIFGYTMEELIGKKINMLAPAQSHDEYSTYIWDYINFKKSGKPEKRKLIRVPKESTGIRKNGEIFPTMLYVRESRVKEGEVFVGIIEDITGRKKAEEALLESEEKFRSLFEESRDAVYITSREGNYIDANQSTLDLLGYTKEEILEIDVLKTYVNPDDRTKFQKEIEEKGYVRDYEIQFQKKDGARMDCLLTTSVRRDKNGNILGYQGIIRDVTKEKILQQQLIQSEKLSSIGTFVSGIAHELNNPLTAVIGFVDLLSQDAENLNDVAKDDLDKIKTQSERAVAIVRNLLQFTRREKPGKTEANINDILENTVKLQEYSFKTDNIEVRKQYAENLPYLLVDSNQLQQVFINILLNAHHAIKKAGIRGDIRVKSKKKGDKVVIEIENDGPTIPGNILSQLFDPFYTTKGPSEGTGLGLYIAIGIVEEHGGRIWAENIGKSGVKFVITLPIADRGTQTQKVETRKTPAPKGTRVLFIDDEENLRDFVTRALKKKGISVSAVSNGKEAIKLIEQNDFDVIISDIKMPVMNGLEVGKWLKKNKPGYLKKFILATGVIDIEIEDYCAQYGCRKILKPYNANEVFKVIGEVVN